MRLDKFLLNEMAWDGVSFDQMADLFGTTEEKIVLCLQREPIDIKAYLLADALLRNNPTEPDFRAGFSRSEIRQSIETLPTKCQRMEDNGFWRDRFIWDDRPPRRERLDLEPEPLTLEQLEDLVANYLQVFDNFTQDDRDTVNDGGLSLTDYLNDLFIECVLTSYVASIGVLKHQTRRAQKKG